jgi:hypothetical protein
MITHPFKLIGVCFLLLAYHACRAEGLWTADNPWPWRDDWHAVSDEQLDSLRGGFDTGQGLTVSFGIIRSVTINGDLVNQTSFNLPDVTKITPDQARLASAAISQAGIVQNGLGNTLDPSIKSQLPTGSLVVQNTLSDQNIQTLTVINAGVNSLGLLKSINSQATLKDALLAPLGVR